MLRALLLPFLVIQLAQSTISDSVSGDKLGCVLSQNGEESVQLWALPNREGIDVQSFADKRLPVRYVHEFGLVIHPPRNIKFLALSVLEISKKQSLVTIDLSGTNATDNDVRVLSTLPNIECLVLDSTNVTDACMEHIEKFKKLRLLSLHLCNVSIDATNRLQYALPGLVRITGEGQTVVSIRDKN